MSSTDSNETNIALRYRTLLTLWFAMMMSVVMWLVVVRALMVTTSPVNQKLGLVLICLGLVPMSLSFLLKQILAGKAINQQSPMLLQQAYVVAWALCEAAGLLGVLAYFVAASPYYWVGLAIAAAGIVLHFPQKAQLLQASGQES